MPLRISILNKKIKKKKNIYFKKKNIYQILLTGHFSNSQQRGQIVSIYEPSTGIVLTPLKEEKSQVTKRL